jgi:hypothetical protein
VKASDEIFQLVKSLSKQEKSYFKKFASAFTDEEGSNYLKMFDEISNQAVKEELYNEDKIKKGNYSGKFLKNLSYHKNYLYNMIMSSLINYHKDNKEIIYIRNLLSQVEILSSKLLYDQALKVLGRASKIAEEKDMFLFIFEINYLDRNLKRLILGHQESSMLVNDFFKNQKDILEKLLNNIEFFYLHDRVNDILRKSSTGKTRSEEDMNELTTILDNDLLKDESKALTFQSKIMMNDILLQSGMSKGDYKDAYKYISANVSIWEKNLSKTQGKIDGYIFALNNLLVTQRRLKLYDECSETLMKMKDLENIYPNYLTDKNKAFIFYSVNILMLTGYLISCDFENLEKQLLECEKDFGPYESKMNPQFRITLYYFLGISNFVLDQYEKSIYWIGKIINIGKTDFSQDYQCYSRIVYLICYYELGYYDSLEYALKSAYHFLSKREKVYKYENIILQYLRRSFRINSPKELAGMFADMKRDLEKIVNDPFEQNAFDAFNILYWLESKIKNITVAEVMKSLIVNR